MLGQGSSRWTRSRKFLEVLCISPPKKNFPRGRYMSLHSARAGMKGNRLFNRRRLQRDQLGKTRKFRHGRQFHGIIIQDVLSKVKYRKPKGEALLRRDGKTAAKPLALQLFLRSQVLVARDAVIVLQQNGLEGRQQLHVEIEKVDRKRHGERPCAHTEQLPREFRYLHRSPSFLTTRFRPAGPRSTGRAAPHA